MRKVVSEDSIPPFSLRIPATSRVVTQWRSHLPGLSEPLDSPPLRPTQALDFSRSGAADLAVTVVGEACLVFVPRFRCPADRLRRRVAAA